MQSSCHTHDTALKNFFSQRAEAEHQWGLKAFLPASFLSPFSKLGGLAALPFTLPSLIKKEWIPFYSSIESTTSEMLIQENVILSKFIILSKWKFGPKATGIGSIIV